MQKIGNSGAASRAAAVLALLLALGCTSGASAFNWGSQQGSGVEKSETRSLGSFSRIKTSGATVLHVTAGQSSTVVTVSCDDNILPLVLTEVRGDTLYIWTDANVSTRLPLRVTIAMPKLAGIQGSGSSRIDAVNVAGEHFELHGSGNTTATVAGSVDALSIHLSGSGQVDASALAAKDADIHGSGSSSVEVNVKDKLAVRLSGSGIVSYLGNPEISQTVSGSGKVVAAR
jgi:putative autotransporter adhesin-like protein